MDPMYENPQMEKYFRSLPPQVQHLIRKSGAVIASPGELMLIGEHFKNNLKEDK